MAADISVYDSDVVPVGKDQKQHIEVTRDLVIKFNDTYGPTLKLPEPNIREEAAVVPGLDGEKMSKSYGNTIGIFEEESAMRKKIMSLKTDSTPVEELRSRSSIRRSLLFTDWSPARPTTRRWRINFAPGVLAMVTSRKDSLPPYGSILNPCDDDETKSSQIPVMSKWCCGKAAQGPTK